MGFDRKWYGPSWGSRCGLDGPTEFSWGPGPVPPGAEYATPEDGGAYRPKAPDMVDPPRRTRRSEARGNPGDVIAQ
ncbi:hypothetical protein [Mycobacterium pseudokansasii]|uniref:Uncharacterized protein n=1 Tax=Mycobacterium pseudokansasii TaxID=2341080 RepID=A0A498QKZ0_9MYCO|nr:hypothetical protein [Mycobacterium pseudokansasii]VBA46711.1 hypothetical protein LAUMK142_00440 [Mycobacterium pseudokansasii]